MNLGTPDRCDIPSVRKYLREFLADPEVIHLPRGLGWLNGALARLIARFRAPKSTEMYRKIWTQRGSPLMVITEDQCAALEAVLPGEWRVFYTMRYGRPSIEATLDAIHSAGVEELVVIPMYPHYSGPTTATALSILYKELERYGHQIQVATRVSWFDDAGYIHAQAARIHEYAESIDATPDNTYLLFSSHGLPVSYVKRGDPYPEHVGRSIELVTQRLGWPPGRCSLAYQSRFGPVEWLQPYCDEVLSQLAADGEKRVLLCPISFTADCLETLEELDIRYRQSFEEAGGELHLCPALNTFGPFITCLKELVLRGPRPMVSWGDDVTPLMSRARASTDSEDPLQNLVMIGVSLPSRLQSERGPKLDYCAPDRLRSAKRSQCDVPDLLRRIRDDGLTSEGWVWNTCRRFEFYGRLDGEGDAKQRERIVAEARSRLFGDDAPADLSVNVLYGADAWRHMLRTASGLNSGLPGERETIEQLEAAHRLARCAGTAGSWSAGLLNDVVSFEKELRCETEWGRFAPEYCHAALSRIIKTIEPGPTTCRGVVIGGSTTSASVLRALIERFGVPSRHLTLLYRGHKKGGQVKMLRKAIGDGRRVRVQGYSDPIVSETISDADLVIFGIDHEQPVLTGEQLAGCRDFTVRPLTVIDFNMFGSTSGLESVAGVRVYSAEQLEDEVAAFADEMCAKETFARAVLEAEEYVGQHAVTVAEKRAGDTRPTAETVGSGMV